MTWGCGYYHDKLMPVPPRRPKVYISISLIIGFDPNSLPGDTHIPVSYTFLDTTTQPVQYNDNPTFVRNDLISTYKEIPSLFECERVFCNSNIAMLIPAIYNPKANDVVTII